MPCETEYASSTLHPSGIVALNSYIRRDLPAPASPTAATICPWPALACSSAPAIAAISRSRPTNRVSPRRAASWKCVLQRPSAHHLVHLDRGVESLYRRRPQRPELEVALAQSLRRLTGRDRTRRRRGLHPRREIRHMTDRRVFGMASSLDRPYHHFARVHSHAGFDRNLALGTQTVGIATQLLLHRQRRMKCALRMILVRDRRAEDCEDAVAGRLRNVAAVTMHRCHHKLQHRVDDRARLLGIEIAHQLGRAFYVGEQGGDGLALAIE